MDEIIFKDNTGKTKMTLKGELLEIKDKKVSEETKEEKEDEDSKS